MNAVNTFVVRRPRWPAPAATAAIPQRRAGVAPALFAMGIATFLPLYATQPLLPVFRQVFQASELLVSLTVASTVLAVALTAPITGLLADRLGRKRVMVASMIGLALPTFLSATSGSLAQFIVWRFLQGIFLPGVIAIVVAYISEEAPRQSVGSTMATYVTGTVVGGFLGRFATGLITAHWGWQTAMVALGFTTLAGALLTWRLLPRSTHFVPHGNFITSLRSVRSHLRNPQLLATYAVGFNLLFCLVATFTYVNFYLADAPFHLGPGALASIFSVYLFGVIVTPIAGRLIDRIGCRAALLGAAAVASAGLLLTLVHYVPVVMAGLTIAACAAFACQSTASSHVGKVATTARSSAAGLYVGMYYLGGCLGSILPGCIWKQAGWIGCVAIIVAVQAVTASLAYRAWKD
jgi:predicted MFS family arabinose efflux permease